MEGQYEVDFIVDERKSNKREEFLIKYTRYNYHECTWEPIKNISKDILEAWKKTDEKIRAQRKRSYKRSMKKIGIVEAKKIQTQGYS